MSNETMIYYVVLVVCFGLIGVFWPGERLGWRGWAIFILINVLMITSRVHEHHQVTAKHQDTNLNESEQRP